MTSAPTFRRYVAIGDSFTEGCGDHDPTRPNGVRGWADRVAEELSDHADARGESFAYANLAVRGRKLDAVLDQQLGAALALQPDLVTCYAGANDILRPRVDVAALLARYESALRRVVDGGAHLVLFTAADPGDAVVYRPVRHRFEAYGQLVRETASRLGDRVSVVDFWAMTDYRDWGYWDTDRMHMATPGHQRMAAEVLDVLGVDHDLPKPPPAPLPQRTLTDRVREDAAWVRRDLLPWVGRRLTGTSSGDSCPPRWPSPVGAPGPVGPSSGRG
ncbi:SGNH/GDSL hydrolase family protein [Nocardioidaceae bacterium]|nr:SGNH/GDSL hydrolase family protein [Nocardioidaceae bacterium]